MEGEKDPLAPAIDLIHPEKNDFLRYALDLLNAGYFWESHVYFEALWNTHGRQGSVADFLKALIKLGAAGVKVSIEQPQLALDHYLRARELFSHVAAAEGETFLGFNLKEIIFKLDQGVTDKLEIYPRWG